MDQTALLSANSIAEKFEFEIRRESIHAADWTERFFGGSIARPTLRRNVNLIGKFSCKKKNIISLSLSLSLSLVRRKNRMFRVAAYRFGYSKPVR